MWTTPVNLTLLRSVFASQLPKRIPYRLGGKAPTLAASPAQLASGIDCSGEVRLLLHQSTNGALTLPDGSWNQRAWCEQNLEEVPYETALRANEGEAFIAFITPNVKGAGRIGHVWLVIGQRQGQYNTTMESYGGHGIGSRPANTPILLNKVHKCFRLPTTQATTQTSTTTAPSASVTPTLFLNGEEVTSAHIVNGHFEAPVAAVLHALKLDFTPDSTTTPAQYRLKVWQKPK